MEPGRRQRAPAESAVRCLRTIPLAAFALVFASCAAARPVALRPVDQTPRTTPATALAPAVPPLISRVHQRTGIAPAGWHSARALHALAMRQGALRQEDPRVGDVVFFRDGAETAPAGIAEAAVVERVEKDGTVVLLCPSARGTLRLRMNTARPSLRRDPRSHKVLNHYLRAAHGKEPARTAAQLFAGYATLPEGGTHVALR